MTFAVRPWRPDIDRAFILDTWIKSYGADKRIAGLNREEYASVYGRFVELILRDADVLVAHPENLPEVVRGFVVGKRGVLTCLHWIYVRPRHRREGIGAALLGELNALHCTLGGAFTFHRSPGAAFLERRRFFYDPSQLGKVRP